MMNARDAPIIYTNSLEAQKDYKQRPQRGGGVDQNCVLFLCRRTEVLLNGNKPLYTPIPVSLYDHNKTRQSHSIRPVGSNILTVTRISNIE